MSDEGTSLYDQFRQVRRRRIIRHVRSGGMLCQFTCDDGYSCQLPESHNEFHSHEFFEAGETIYVPAPDPRESKG